MKLEKTLYHIALSDLSVARHLYGIRKHSQSLFYFQQSVEKANKAFALINEMVKPEELLQVGHDSMAIYRKSIESRRSEIEETIADINLYPKARQHEYFGHLEDYKKQLLTGQNFLKNLKNNSVNRLQYSELNYILDELEELERFKFSLPDNFKEELGKSFEKYFSFIEGFETTYALKSAADLRVYLADPQKMNEVAELCKNIIPRVLKFAFVNYTLYFSAIITIGHVTKTRYPYLTPETSPLKIYNRNYPLVNLQPYFMRTLSKALKQMPLLFESLQADNSNK